MSRERLPKSQRIYIRREKARIRREVFNMKEQNELINKLYQGIVGNNKIKEKTKDGK